MSLENFPWPPLPGTTSVPYWNGQHFITGESIGRILPYAVDSSHWSNDLTSLHEAEAGDDHPIDRASRRLAVSSMQRLTGQAPVVLDVGCSSGFVLRELQKSLPGAELIGADYLRGPLEGLAQRMPTMPILQFDLRKCPLPNACIDGVTCLNVLEHIDDHEKALDEIHRILKVGGIAHVEVPAGPGLFDIYDEYLMHHRRYRLGELIAMAQKSGFTVEQATHLGCFVFPAFWWVKNRNRRKMHLPTEEKARLVAAQIRATKVNAVFAATIQLETLIGSFVSYPLGIRCVAVLRKSKP